MPNWCRNILTITGPKDSVASLVSAIKGPDAFVSAKDAAKILPLSFHSLVPVPKNILKYTFGGEKERQEGTYLPISGYDWCVYHWGTKWNAHDTQVDYDAGSGRAAYIFETAWSPPTTFIRKIAKDYPELTFFLEYEEDGCDYKGAIEVHGDEYSENNQPYHVRAHDEEN